MYMDNWSEQLFDIIGRTRKGRSNSRAAAVVKEPCSIMFANNPNRIKSKAASVLGINKVKMISDFISSNGTL